MAVNTTIVFENFHLRGGTVAGAGVLSVSGAMQWTGGTMSGEGITQIEPSASLACFVTIADAMTHLVMNVIEYLVII